MKTLCFYNHKGGVGKTLLNGLMASYLAYGCGKRVAVIDFTCVGSIVQARKADETLKSDESSWLSRYLRNHGLEDRTLSVSSG